MRPVNREPGAEARAVLDRELADLRIEATSAISACTRWQARSHARVARMARHLRAAWRARVRRVRLAAAAMTMGRGSIVPGALVSLLASRAKMVRSAAAAPRLAVAAVAAASRGLAGSQRASLPVAATVVRALHTVIMRAAPMTGKKAGDSGGAPGHCQG